MSHIEPKVPLELLDPGSADPGYWLRFQNQVMEAVRPALARRWDRSLTLGDAVLAWSRYVVPLALAAAACAALFLMRDQAPDVRVAVGVEDFLLDIQRTEASPLPSFFHTEEVVDRDIVLLAVEGI
jgi:hypothetical protein